MQPMKNPEVADFSRALSLRPWPDAVAEPAPVAGTASTIALPQLLAILRRRIGWLVLALLLGLGAGVAAIQMTVPRYVSTAQIIIDPRGLKVLDTEVQPAAQSADAVTNLVESEMRVVKGSDVLHRVVERFHLARDPEFDGSRTSVVGEWIGRIKAGLALLTGPGGARAAPDPTARAVAALDTRLAVRRIERSFVVEVTMTSEDPDKSAKIANAVVDAYIARSAEWQAEVARASGASISTNLDEMQARVRAAEDAVEQFKTASRFVNVNGRLLSDQQLGDLNMQLGRTRTQVTEAQARLEQLTKDKARQGTTPLPEGADSLTIGALRLQLAEVKRRYANAENKLGPRHPELMDLRRELQEAQGSINIELDRLAQHVRNDLDRAREAERLIQKEIAAQSRTAVSASKGFVQLRELERTAEASRSVYNAALVRSRQLQEQSLLNSTNIRKIAPAVPPERPAGAPAGLILAVAAACGLLAGGSAAVAADLLGGAVRTPADLESAAGLMVTGTIPVARHSVHPVGSNFFRRGAKPWLEIADTFRLGHPGGPQVLAVTSIGAEGISGFVALDLARAMASVGTKVLVIDTAVGARGLTSFLGLERLPGLGACAARRASLAATALPIPEDGIAFLPAESGAANDLRRIGGIGLVGVVRQALATYSFVVLDFGAAGHESLPLVAAAADAGVLVVEKGGVQRAEVRRAASLCRTAKLPLAGALLAAPASFEGHDT